MFLISIIGGKVKLLSGLLFWDDNFFGTIAVSSVILISICAYILIVKMINSDSF